MNMAHEAVLDYCRRAASPLQRNVMITTADIRYEHVTIDEPTDERFEDRVREELTNAAARGWNLAGVSSHFNNLCGLSFWRWATDAERAALAADLAALKEREATIAP